MPLINTVYGERTTLSNNGIEEHELCEYSRRERWKLALSRENIDRV